MEFKELINKMLENKEIIIEDFEEYLKENDFKISKNDILNKQYINNYIVSLNYDISNETDSYSEEKEIEDKFYEILDEYCCKTISNI